MQGVLGVKPLIPRSRRLRSTTRKWKRKFLEDNPGISSQAEMSLFGLWAYDTLWALAMAAERVGIREPSTSQSTRAFNSTNMFATEISQTGPKLLGAILGTTFQGLGGIFRLVVPKGWEFPVSGKKLKVGVPAKAGFTQFVKVERDPQTDAPIISGYYIDLFDSVMANLHHGAVRYEYVPFETNDDSSAMSYDALLYEVFNGTYDAAVGDITITANRSQYVDFTLPIEEGGVTRTQKIQYDNPNNEWFFLKPLKKELWLTAIALFIFDWRERIVSNLARLVVVVWVFVVLILSSTYTASLSARLTAWKLKKADIDVDVLIRNGDSVGCREGSFIVQYLKDLGFNESKIRRYSNPEDFDDALSRGSEKDGITTLFSRTPYTNLFLSKYCNKYMKVGSPFLTEGFAFAFAKGSPLVADVSQTIIELIDNGRMSEIRAHWLKDSTCNEDEPDLSTASWKNVDLNSFKILFGFTGAITATFLVVFLVTYLYKNRDFIQRISSSSTTIWSKIRAFCQHFDQRDPKSFRSSRSKEDGENASPNVIAYQTRPSTIVPVESDDVEDANGVVPTNSDHRDHADESRSVQLENIRVV
ncbi:Glutamate receptor 2.8 [Sesamum alatum]|uniref:Glutamate receptor 2.8 n=1 Tax=Sesamum alatum TaxID=300844 RepID=A0AAE1YGX9_9LAMI|nr:Glutamate receptor 2.8 [Sesamum alatum]